MDHLDNPQPAASGTGARVSLINHGSVSRVSITPSTMNVPVVGGRRVLITPLRAHQQVSDPMIRKQPLQQQPLQQLQPSGIGPGVSLIHKVLVKAVSKNKKSHKTFTLRNVDTTATASCESLKKLIKAQLKQEIIGPDKFDMGFIQGSNVINIRSKEDLQEVWSDLLKSTGSSSKPILWCDGLKEVASTSGNRKRQKCDSDDDSDCESNKPSKKKKVKSNREETEDKVQETIDYLKEKHGSKFTTMQLRIWAEMIVGNYHTDKEEPPNNTMFSRAGGHTSKRESQSMTKALSDVACAITSALSPKSILPASGKGSNSSSCSPVKVTIESRSKLYKQLGELKNLMTIGVLSEEEYMCEKDAIMDLLREINSR